MVISKSSHWIGDPSSVPTEYITLGDVVTVSTGSVPGNSPGSISYAVGSAASGESYSLAALQFMPPGMMSVALPPGNFGGSSINIKGDFVPAANSTEAHQGIWYVRNDEWYLIGSRDTRSQFKVGNIQIGETAIYNQLAQGSVLLKNDGSVTLTTRVGNTPNGANTQLVLSPTGLYYIAPWGKISFDAAGFRVQNYAGASIGLTGSSNPTSGSGCQINAGSTNINSCMINLGTGSNATPFPAVYGTIPAVAPGVPLLGNGVGAVVNQASSSTQVFISP